MALCLLAGLQAPGAASQPGSEDREAIDALLQNRSQAVLAGDKQAFLATVWPGDAAFRERQASWFDNIADIDLASYRTRADWQAYGDLLRPSDFIRYEGVEAAALPLTRERYRIARFDERPASQDQFLTFVKDGGRWFVADDDDVEDVGLYTQRNLWDFAPVRSVRSDRVVLLMPACRSACPVTPAVVLRAAETALDVVERRWTLPWSGRVPLFAPASNEDLARILQATFPVEDYVAFAFWTGEKQRGTSRIILNPRAFAGVGRERAISVLTHELLHVASLPWSGPAIPHFMDEGIAQFVQYGGRSSVINAASRDARAQPRLPANHEFFLGGPAPVQRSYRRSLSFVGYLARRYGFPEVQRFYRRAGSFQGGPGTARWKLERALKRSFGAHLGGLERRWASSIGAS